jgi:hypothetical protein
MSMLRPEEIEKHRQNINRLLETSRAERGMEANKHRGLSIVQQP